jgi:hypothetical protein
MGDPQVLENFVIFALNNYRAKHYYLVFGDHGNGVEGLCEDESSEVGKDGWGAPEYDWLTLNELKSALQNVKEKTKVTFDIIGFDCCLMATIEVAYAIKDYGRIMVASQNVEYVPGWFLESVFSEVLTNPQIQNEELAKIIVRKYGLNHYEVGRPSFTLSAIKLDKIPSVIYPLAEISQRLTNILKSEKDNNFTDENLVLTKITELRDSIPRVDANWSPYMYMAGEYVDLYDLAERLGKISLTPEITSLTDELKSALTEAIIISTANEEKFFVHGLSIRFFNINKIPADLDFPQQWMAFLDTWQDCYDSYQKLNPPAQPPAGSPSITSELPAPEPKWYEKIKEWFHDYWLGIILISLALALLGFLVWACLLQDKKYREEQKRKQEKKRKKRKRVLQKKIEKIIEEEAEDSFLAF